MRRIIGTAGATLAIAVVMATAAAPAGAAGPGISGDGIDQDDLVSASHHARNGQYVVQENIPPSLSDQPGGSLFGVQ
jgi:hypothetical protein